jgi:hypothetical protein
MGEQRKHSGRASRQAVGVLMGAQVGFAIAVRQLFTDHAGVGAPWPAGLSIMLLGCLAGLILATLVAGESTGEGMPAALSVHPDTEEAARVRFGPPRGNGPVLRAKTEDSIEGVRGQDEFSNHVRHSASNS